MYVFRTKPSRWIIFFAASGLLMALMILAPISTRLDPEDMDDTVGGYRVTVENTAEVLRVSENP